MGRATDYDRGDLSLALIVADGEGYAAQADQAIGLISGEFRSRIDWNGLLHGGLDHCGLVELVVAEAQGVAHDVLTSALPHLSELHARTDARFIISIDRDQIDTVANALLGDRVELLCQPTLADRAAAIAIGLHGSSRGTLQDSAGEGGSAQLRQLSEEVSRISRALSRLANEDRQVAGVNERPISYTPPAPAPIAPPVTAARVRKIIRGRRLRDQFFADGLFEDPAWDMLLDLYAAELEGVQVSVSSLCIAASVAPTTALRWIGRMTELGLFVRRPDPFDGRRAFLGLSPETRAKIDLYFAALQQSGFEVL